MNDGPAPLVSMRGIDKTFFGVHANRGVDFDLYPGEVHSLLGENGAGKTTLMNVLSGIYAPDEGTLEVQGVPVAFRSPRDAIARGIGMVHQHFMLVPVLSVWENMILGLEDTPQVLPRRAVVERIRELSGRYGLEVDPLARVWQLSIGEQQRVEILKMLYRGSRVLVLDEPTSVLTPQEAKQLFATLRRMTGEGHGVVFISHKMEEVLALSDRLTVLRKGVRVSTVPASGVTREELAEMMVGRKVDFQVPPREGRSGATVLECRDLRARNDRGVEVLKGLSLSLRSGEILGLAGVAGNGQQELCEVCAGLRPLEGGQVFLEGEDLTGASPRRFQERQVAYIPADRKGTGLIPNMNLRENVALKRYWKKPGCRWRFFVDWEVLAGITGELVGRYEVSAPSLGSPVRVLSGGNLQKLMLARELSDEPRVVLAMQPTWGLDVGATQFVHQQLRRERDRGAGVLLVSEDLDELLQLSDRLAVVYQGRIMGVLEDPRSCGQETVGLMMAGADAGLCGGGAA